MLAPEQFYDGFHRIFDGIENGTSSFVGEELCALHHVYLVLAIDAWDEREEASRTATGSAEMYIAAVDELQMVTLTRGDMSTLQSLLLWSLFLQLSGQHALLAQVSGMTMRLAQSLGLHRHTRRFKFCAGELEIRNRLWWCTYILDM